MMSDQRIQHEIVHGKFLKETLPVPDWYWQTPAGKVRWQRRVTMLAAHVTPKMKVLEIGCGVGALTQEIANTKALVHAIDISPDLLNIAKKRVSVSNVTFQIANAYNLTFLDESFDTVIGSSVLHHLELDKALKEFYRVLKPGGTLYLTEPNTLNPHVYLERKIPGLKKWLKISPDETSFIRWKLFKNIEVAGFSEITITLFDFLHPWTPLFLIPFMDRIGVLLEKIPLMKEVAGSLYIRAKKNF